MFGIPQVEAIEVQRWIEAEEAVLVDVRPEYSFAACHVPGAHSLPLYDFHPSKLPPSTGKRLVFVCEHGISSQEASRIAIACAIDAVYNLIGGMQAWREADLPTASI